MLNTICHGEERGTVPPTSLFVCLFVCLFVIIKSSNSELC